RRTFQESTPDGCDRRIAEIAGAGLVGDSRLRAGREIKSDLTGSSRDRSPGLCAGCAARYGRVRMTRFLESVPLFFTPLTPIHIGCGEVFEPTNYVIEGAALYEFEPARLSLSDADRRTLVQSVNKQGDDAIRAVQRFFHDRRPACRNISRLMVPVASG